MLFERKCLGVFEPVRQAENPIDAPETLLVKKNVAGLYSESIIEH